jgi:CBS domain containing-hemolysin-like protein
VGSVSLRQPLVVSPSFPLIDLLNTFQEGRSHLALVSHTPQHAIEWYVHTYGHQFTS